MKQYSQHFQHVFTLAKSSDVLKSQQNLLPRAIIFFWVFIKYLYQIIKYYFHKIPIPIYTIYTFRFSRCSVFLFVAKQFSPEKFSYGGFSHGAMFIVGIIMWERFEAIFQTIETIETCQNYPLYNSTGNCEPNHLILIDVSCHYLSI